MGASLFKVFYDVEQMADGSGQAIKANDDEHVASREILQQFRKNRPRTRRAGSVFLVNAIAPGRAQFVNLGIIELIVC
ncbi:hypothetical protein GGE07_006095 [Sinorhizobium terangae]|nr:hypothetical protein [Sinorhizobium terangae]